MKDPAFLFYSNDFLSGTFLMTDEQVGKYIRILCLLHQKNRLTKKDMLNICKTYDEDIFSKFLIDGKGLYYNDRLEKEAIRRKNYSESRRKNRQNKQEKENSNPKKQKVSKSYVKHMETETETETINKDKNKTEIVYPFETENFIKLWNYWKQYKKEEHNFTYKSALSEQAALKNLGKISENNEENALLIIEHSISQGYKGLFKPNNNGQQTTKKDRLQGVFELIEKERQDQSNVNN